MQDINNYIKENDTDNVTLNKLKELGTKLTGQENVQGETVSEVLDFINNNYSGGGSGSKTVLYLDESEFGSTQFAYKDKDCTIKADMNELYNTCENGCVFVMSRGKILPCAYLKLSYVYGEEPNYTVVYAVANGTLQIYSSEYKKPVE